MRAMGEGNVDICKKCNQLWPTHKLEQQPRGNKDMADVTISMDILRMSILNMLDNMTTDTPLTSELATPHPKNEAPWLWFTTATLGHPILTDEFERSLHPAILAFIHKNTASHDSLDHMDEAGHLYDHRTDNILDLMRDIATYWKSLPTSTLPTDDPSTTIKSNRERFTVSHIARNPIKLPESPLLDEKFDHMILNPPKIGAVRIYMAPGAIKSSTGDLKADTFQEVTTLVTTKG